jgi:hypothetical protein
MFNELDESVTNLNESLKNLLAKLLFRAMNWKIKIIDGDPVGAKENLQELYKILEQMNFYTSSYKIH